MSADKPEDGTGPSGIDLARAALAAARAEARRRGVRPGSAGAGESRVRRRSGAGPDDRDPQPLAATIRRLLAERGWEMPAAVHTAMARWDDIVGPEVAAHCRPQRFDDGELIVQADSTAWATQVRLLAADLVCRLNTELGHGTVKRVKVLGPGAPARRKGSLRVFGGRGPRDTYG
ncbi:DUF721 domain-containing protein [Carbonactinospora thermoautotrophica]|uniref:DUF721 domain-containing protein n=1 Tax=Carbonactinospora thermoautotrophica TaxID=1469144 RepID=UPI00226FC00E|nr:DciA family protein [Carbonactinospora thermoautotrophica]MCX9192006.1 DUF721 domain-containing protein [Carbonactinospora thermoautotrophica]